MSKTKSKSKFYAIESKLGTWMNQAGREALGISEGSFVTITPKTTKKTKPSISREICLAPTAASRCIRATFAITGLLGIGIVESDLNELGLKPGDPVELKMEVREASGGGVGMSLKDRMEEVLRESGDILNELSASEVKSGVYAAAKKLGFKVRKFSDDAVERV